MDVTSASSSDFSDDKSEEYEEFKYRERTHSETDGSHDNSDETSIEAPTKITSNSRITRLNANKRFTRSAIMASSDDNNSTEISVDHTSSRAPTSARKSKRGRKINKSVEYAYDDSSSDEYSPDKSPNRKVKRKMKKKKPKQSEDELFYPDVQKWPKIGEGNLKVVKRVAALIMKEMEEMDTDYIFKYPVAEAYPDIASRYLSIIKDPVDFRTINAQNIENYTEISELQDDLILVFKNCCMFNGEESCWWSYAVSCWKRLEDVFKDVCKEENIMLPRRF